MANKVRLPEERRHPAPLRRIPRPANDNVHPNGRRRLLALAAVVFSALALVAAGMTGWR